MILYFSGIGIPSLALLKDATVMTTFWDCFKSKNGITRDTLVALNSLRTRKPVRVANREGVKYTIQPIRSLFLDSGSFSLWTIGEKYAREHDTEPYAYYETDEFWDYLDAYVGFVETHGVDTFANVDVLPYRGIHGEESLYECAKLSWRNLKAMEKRSVRPVPVVHFPSPMRILKRYLDRGYRYIGLGGLVGSIGSPDTQRWLDECFTLVSRYFVTKPVKIHGFGVTSYPLLIRYPWWSVDSTAWVKRAGYGKIFVPKKKHGEYSFDVMPYDIRVSHTAPKNKDMHIEHFDELPQHTKAVTEWLERIDVPLGENDREGNVVVAGVINDGTMRQVANLRFFETLVKALPEWPWPFRAHSPEKFFDD